MANLKKFLFTFDQKNDDWALKNLDSGRTLRHFDTKADAIKGGVLKNVIGVEGGSVKIHKVNGRFDEERTFPGSKDPHSSKG